MARASSSRRLAAGLIALATCLALAWLFLAFHGALLTQLDPALALPDTAEVPTDAGAGEAEVTESMATLEESIALRRMANALPALALSLLLLAATRRPLLSLWLSLLAVSGLYAIDAMKFENLHARLLPADFALLPQVVSGFDLYWAYARGESFGLRHVLALVVVTATLFLEPAQRWLRPWLRIGVAATAVFLAWATLTERAPVAHWYDEEALGFSPWQPDSSIQQTGLIAGLIKLAGEGPWQVPQPDEDYVSVVLNLHPVSDTPAVPAAADLPDLIVWQSESLFDPARLQAIPGDRHLRHFKRLRQRTIHGDMIVPAYGGGTVRTEFEALTGYPLHAFPGVNYPYSALAQRPLLALPRLLREYGYRTIAIHPYERDFWSRDSAMAHLGFDVYEDKDVFEASDYHGYFIGDEALLRRVAQTLARDDAQPRFVFAISMENHGPWRQRPNINRGRLRQIPVPEELPDDQAKELRYYLYHADNADRQLQRLIDLADASARHTIVLFYGDHLPGLEHVFRVLPFEDGLSPWQQPVPFLLYDNRNGHRGEADGTLRSYHLASLLLDAAGLSGDPRWQVLSADRERHGRTGLNGIVPHPELDYDHALWHLSWHLYRQPVEPTPTTIVLH